MKIRQLRLQPLMTIGGASIAFAAAGFWWWWAWVGLLLTGPLVLLGVWDLLQTRHGLLRNYPLVGHLRFLLEDTGPELRQYIVESNTEGRPFNRDQRSLMYQRAKGVSDKKPFGTELSIYEPPYFWIAHSMAPRAAAEQAHETLRTTVGGPQCGQPYDASVYNISAMSFGSISANAIRSMNRGAKMGGFAQVTGEGGISRYHREHGGDLIWQIGTGYFGCRAEDGAFDADVFAEQASSDQVRMIEIKISQGAKPGHGGILPGEKVTTEIAEARHVRPGMDCSPPSYHTAFRTPLELCAFIGRLRELIGGKPVGFKLCVGRPDEVFAICKAMLETEILPDFITVDGAEGGTGAAPIEFSDHVGMPLREGLVLVQNALVGIGVRDHVRVAASGKLVTAASMAASMALGADWCNTARGFMFAVGCIQAQACHTNECPVGVATQDPSLQRAIVVKDKAERVRNFHHTTVDALAELVGAAGLGHPSELSPAHVFNDTATTEIYTLVTLYSFIEPGQLLDGHAGALLQRYWDRAHPDAFAV
jgi:glutamate synthase domain-containing protein 2